MDKLILKFKGLDIVLTAKFVLVGIIGFLVNFVGLRFFVNTFGMNNVLSEVLATIIALQITFVFHNSWTYNTLNSTNEHYHLSLWQRYVAFISSNTIGSLMTIGAFAITSTFIDSKFVALGLAAVLGTTWNYFANLYFTWKKDRE